MVVRCWDYMMHVVASLVLYFDLLTVSKYTSSLEKLTGVTKSQIWVVDDCLTYVGSTAGSRSSAEALSQHCCGKDCFTSILNNSLLTSSSSVFCFLQISEQCLGQKDKTQPQTFFLFAFFEPWWKLAVTFPFENQFSFKNSRGKINTHTLCWRIINNLDVACYGFIHINNL